jgi:hypothetical protein
MVRIKKNIFHLKPLVYKLLFGHSSTILQYLILKIKTRKSSASWRETMTGGPAANSDIRYLALPILIITYFNFGGNSFFMLSDLNQVAKSYVKIRQVKVTGRAFGVGFDWGRLFYIRLWGGKTMYT